MSMANKMNAIQMIQNDLERAVKNAVAEKVVAENMERIEKELRQIIQPAVEKITFKSIESVHEMMKLRDELYIYLKWDDVEEVTLKKVPNG